MENIQAVFLDRDGTIGGTDEVVFPKDFVLYSNSEIAIKKLISFNIPIYSFTNQPDISQGLVSENDFREELLSFGFNDVYICPHSPKDNCACRKPNVGMLLNAKMKHGLDLKKTIIIGDRWTDMIAAEKVGAIKILVLTGCGKESILHDLDKWNQDICDYIALDLLDAVNWIIEKHILNR